MLLPASQDYIALCHSQVSLLLQGLGAQEIAVYLTEQFEPTGAASLAPLVVYPEVKNLWPQSIQWQLPNGTSSSNYSSPLILEGSVAELGASGEPMPPSSFAQEPRSPSGNPDVTEPRQQIVLPLMHDSAMLGVLMVARFGNPWTRREQSQVEQVAHTLSMACVLDQRSQWLSQSGFEKQALLSEEHQRLSKLLHQFRNPLTALKTLGKLMLRRMNLEDPNRDFAQTIVQQSDRLEMMLREFSQTLDIGEETIETIDQPWSLASGESTPLLLPAAGVISGSTLNLQPCWLGDVLSPILMAAVGRLEERELELSQLIPDNLPPIQGDVQALTEVFSNLLDNAIKYTPEGGTIAIVLTQELSGDDIPQPIQVVYLSDTGLGIPQADLTRIFEGQYRGMQAESEIQGTGLGLAIARDLIQKMNGDILAFSPGLIQERNFRKVTGCQGSTFKVILPEMSQRIVAQST
jgi:signal transduction histidine kinase